MTDAYSTAECSCHSAVLRATLDAFTQRLLSVERNLQQRDASEVYDQGKSKFAALNARISRIEQKEAADAPSLVCAKDMMNNQCLKLKCQLNSVETDLHDFGKQHIELQKTVCNILLRVQQIETEKVHMVEEPNRGFENEIREHLIALRERVDELSKVQQQLRIDFDALSAEHKSELKKVVKYVVVNGGKASKLDHSIENLSERLYHTDKQFQKVLAAINSRFDATFDMEEYPEHNH